MGFSITVTSILRDFSNEPKLGDIKKRAKQIKKDHELAMELWSTENHSCRLLATLIFDKKQLTEQYLLFLVADLVKLEVQQRNQLGDWLLANQLMKDKSLTDMMESWQHSETDMFRRWFWYYQARLRWTGKTPPPSNSSELLNALEKDLANEVPEVQWVMNYCAGQIGIFEANLRARCIALGERCGLYKGEKVVKNCTPAYLPEFIKIEVEKRES